ncbi:unnamed protein product [Spirodela intermedia]|uniref:Uncharacterized protein n=1 Tax=Spirodela intermedia TaxID=51605 RepID=A0A7I8JHV0_SPIIN|nr:unnamed protein product [Spirodela intermedia]CAA6669726.1 unnamed protein product [Spirodela intermedia]
MTAASSRVCHLALSSTVFPRPRPTGDSLPCAAFFPGYRWWEQVLEASPALVSSAAAEAAALFSFASIFPLEAVLFDIDGTLCDSDPIHYFAFREMLQEVGYNGGEPITEEFFAKNISGGHNDDLARFLFPDWDHKTAMKFMDDKEAMFRSEGLHKLCRWIEDRRLKRAALMISILGLSDFFEVLVVGSECERAKPFPDPYLKALKLIGASSDHTFVFEDSASGIKAGVAAGMPGMLLDAGAALLIGDFEDPKLWAALEEDERRAAAAGGA